MTPLSVIREALAAVAESSPVPWQYKGRMVTDALGDGVATTCCETDAESALIAAAPAWLAELIQRLLLAELEGAVVRDGHWDEVVDERDNLRADVDRVTARAEAAEARASEAYARCEAGYAAYSADGAAAERAAIVAWLRSRWHQIDHFGSGLFPAPEQYAYAIEGGAHLAKEPSE